ncbi:hypothetical protein EJD97_010505 [Solanum chilense]|uniref:FAS1 domain-containing protein n=1 Tax=Solanum chilense TaxID=4083 RepID=A0A6N2BIR5_SOLCI|nr:hypothetical protein EJD97_010505 [Solanum chilense]
MPHQKPLPLILLSTLPLLFILTQAQSPTAPAPAPTGPIDIFAILKKEGQYNTFIKFLNESQVGNQINNQVNNSNQGMTVLAPSDNAFNNLPSGTLNQLNDQQKVQLILNHVIPKFYTFDDLQTVSNPVRTQATGPKGEPFGLNFTGSNNQVNVSSGSVVTNIYNAIRKDPPLAVFQLDKVLVPSQFTDPSSDDDAPAPTKPKNGTSNDKTTADEPPPASNTKPNDAKRISGGILGLVCGVFLMATLS